MTMTQIEIFKALNKAATAVYLKGDRGATMKQRSYLASLLSQLDRGDEVKGLTELTCNQAKKMISGLVPLVDSPRNRALARSEALGKIYDDMYAGRITFEEAEKARRALQA